MEKALTKLQAAAAAEKRALRDLGKAERRVGRLLARFSRAAQLFAIEIQEGADPAAPGKKGLQIAVARKAELEEWAALADGCYLLRTNLIGKSAVELWKTYIGLTQMEDSFRISKHDLGLRPVFHHTEERTQVHILVCFLALVMWRTLQQWMEASGLGSAPRKLLEEMAEVRSLDVVLPTGGGAELRLRTVSRPEPHLAILLQRLGLVLPGRAKQIQNVVEKIAVKNEISQQMGKSIF